MEQDPLGDKAMTRYFALLLPVVVCLSGCSRNQVAWEQSAREEKAVKAIEALGGRVTRDETLPGRPVVEVDLIETNAQDSDLKILKELKGLQHLYLSDTPITDAGLKDLKELKELQTLFLDGTKITDAGLKELKELKELKGLKTLFLWETQITDAGLKELKGLGLQKLYLIGNLNITDAGLAELKELKGLRGLWLDSPRITEAGLKDLQQALPKTHIEWSYKPER
jgi:internalin A